MKQRNTQALISRIKNSADSFIMSELGKNGAPGLVPSHGSILHHLYLCGSRISMKELAEKIHKTQPTVTVLVNKLSDLGYVTKSRCAEDSRVFYVSLTDEGRDFQKKFQQVSRTLISTMHKGLTPEESDMLDSLLARIAENF